MTKGRTMASRGSDRRDIPVLLLHNIDRGWPSEAIDEALQDVAKLESSLRNLGHPVKTVTVSDKDLSESLRNDDPSQCVILNWCEELPGIPNSDGLVVQWLEKLGFTYTGSTCDVLELCWEKEKIKKLLIERGLPTPRWCILETSDTDSWNCYPAIVKPAREHCSFGITSDAVVMDPAALSDRVAYILKTFRQPALVEDFIDGREFHVSLWGNDEVQMLPPAEMDFVLFDNLRDRLCTYDSKFKPGSTHYEQILLRLPAPLSDAEYDRLQRLAVEAYRVSGCRDYARLDIRQRDGVFYILDINPNPDISSEASMACAAEHVGYSYGAMGSYLVNLASFRHPGFGGCSTIS
jgi:D-alanine-D-alanine ligase